MAQTARHVRVQDNLVQPCLLRRLLLMLDQFAEGGDVAHFLLDAGVLIKIAFHKFICEFRMLCRDLCLQKVDGGHGTAPIACDVCIPCIHLFLVPQGYVCACTDAFHQDDLVQPVSITTQGVLHLIDGGLVGLHTPKNSAGIVCTAIFRLFKPCEQAHKREHDVVGRLGQGDHPFFAVFASMHGVVAPTSP